MPHVDLPDARARTAAGLFTMPVVSRGSAGKAPVAAPARMDSATPAAPLAVGSVQGAAALGAHLAWSRE